MSKRTFLLICLLAVVSVSGLAAAAPKTTSIPHPFFFTENRGQWDERVLYKCSARDGMTWFLERDGITLLMMVPGKSKPPMVDPGTADLQVCMQKHPPAKYPMKSHALKFRFVSGEDNTDSRRLGFSLTNPEFSNVVGLKSNLPIQNTASAKSIDPLGELPWHNNYFLGNDSTKWAPDCRNYTNIIYRDVWDGIDIEWYESNGKLEFDFVVQPGADPYQIRMSCEGLTGDLSPTGKELKLPTSLGELRTALPQVYQISAGGSRSEVNAQFEIVNKNEFGVTLPNGYQKEHTLRIDPLVYSTFLGGSGDDEARGICSDNTGGVFIVGATNSTNYPVTGIGQPFLAGDHDCIVTHLNSTGSQLLYSTYIGGSGYDYGMGIVNDGQGGVIVAGTTYSANFPYNHSLGIG